MNRFGRLFIRGRIPSFDLLLCWYVFGLGVFTEAGARPCVRQPASLRESGAGLIKIIRCVVLMGGNSRQQFVLLALPVQQKPPPWAVIGGACFVSRVQRP